MFLSPSFPARTTRGSDRAVFEDVRRTLDAAIPDGPVALGLSGGGDSAALMLLAAEWAARRGRALHALIVDHGLQAGSADTAALAARRARAAGVPARILRWTGAKPATGVQAAARAARLRLLAGACREMGATTLLLAHTRDDQAETVWLRLQAGSSWRGLAAMRPAAPCPIWPEGRGLTLLRPLLGVSRARLRAVLRQAGADWTEDKANSDRLYARVRARQTLALLGADAAERLLALARAARTLADAEDDAAQALWRAHGAAGADGTLRLARAALAAPGGARLLQAALAAVSGQAHPPARSAVDRALDRLAAGGGATLGGAAAYPRGGGVLIVRDPGAALGRAGAPARPAHMLRDGRDIVWDGRFAVRLAGPGDTLAPLGRDIAALPDQVRAALKAAPAPARPTLPAIRRGGVPVAIAGTDIAAPGAAFAPLAEERLLRLLFPAAP